MRGPLIVLGSIFAAFAGVMGWYMWDSSANHGFEFGYFGQFNRVSKAARAVPGVSITNSWYHGDIDLEEFGLTLSLSGKPVTLFFSESDPVRTMNHEAAVAALKRRIESESVTTK
jgi:hypothetical protein